MRPEQYDMVPRPSRTKRALKAAAGLAVGGAAAYGYSNMSPGQKRLARARVTGAYRGAKGATAGAFSKAKGMFAAKPTEHPGQGTFDFDKKAGLLYPESVGDVGVFDLIDAALEKEAGEASRGARAGAKAGGAVGALLGAPTGYAIARRLGMSRGSAAALGVSAGTGAGLAGAASGAAHGAIFGSVAETQRRREEQKLIASGMRPSAARKAVSGKEIHRFTRGGAALGGILGGLNAAGSSRRHDNSAGGTVVRVGRSAVTGALSGAAGGAFYGSLARRERRKEERREQAKMEKKSYLTSESVGDVGVFDLIDAALEDA